MKFEALNGVKIPYESSIKELGVLLDSSVMSDFTLACEALSYKRDDAAYQLMKQHIKDRDKYRRLYILKTIFRHPRAVELLDFLEGALLSDDPLFVRNALNVISEHRIKVSEALLISVVKANLSDLYFNVRALSTLDISDENYRELTSLFKEATKCGQREIIGEVLCEGYLPAKASELIELFRHDKFAKIRLSALKIAKEHGYNLTEFLSDIDGHVRGLAKKSLGELSFIAKYIPEHRVDISDDLCSAIIYNTYSEDHLYVEYDRSDEFTPYTLSFSFHHIHLIDQESADEWVDEIINERVYAIEYFKGECRVLGGQISAEDLENLSYDFLEEDTGYYAMTKLYEVADHFKLRGWSRKNDFDGHFIEVDGEIEIEKIKSYSLLFF